MAKAVGVFITNWTNLGTTVPVPQWSVDIEINWINNDGSADQNISTQTFPNALTGVPTRRLKKYMEAIIMTELRLQLGIDVDDEA